MPYIVFGPISQMVKNHIKFPSCSARFPNLHLEQEMDTIFHTTSGVEKAMEMQIVIENLGGTITFDTGASIYAMHKVTFKEWGPAGDQLLH